MDQKNEEVWLKPLIFQLGSTGRRLSLPPGFHLNVSKIIYLQGLLSLLIFHHMMSMNLTSKKSFTEIEYRVWKLLSCRPTNLKNIRFRSSCENNHKTLLSKVKSLNRRIFSIINEQIL